MISEGKVLLVGFELESEEKSLVNRTLERYLRKIEEKTSYQELRLNLKKSAHGKTFMHEIQGSMITGKRRTTSNATGYNLYKVLSEVLEKILNEIEHKERTSRQTSRNL